MIAALKSACQFIYSEKSRIAIGSAKAVAGVLAVIPYDKLRCFFYDHSEFYKKLAGRAIDKQEAVQAAEFFSGKNLFVLERFVNFSTVFILPVFEEWVFRSKLYTEMEKMAKSLDPVVRKVLLLVGNSALFACIHLSPFQKRDNAHFFFHTFQMGLLFTTLRQFTGDATASIGAHIFLNARSIHQLFYENNRSFQRIGQFLSI